MDRICNAYGIKIDEKNYPKYRSICKNCHNKNRRKNIDNTVNQKENSASHQQPKVDIDNKNSKINIPEKNITTTPEF